jgi:hypothetical protein
MNVKASFKNIIFCICVACFSGLAKDTWAFPDITTRVGEYKPYQIDISSLMDFYGTLSSDEKEEQLKDWAFYGLFSSLEIKQEEINSSGEAETPMRYPSLKEKQNFKIQPGRIAVLNDKTCVMLIPQREIENKPLQGSLFDQEMFSSGTVPEKVYIFSYIFDPAGTAITTSYIRTISGQSLLTQEYGYIQKQVTDTESLKEFLLQTDCLIKVIFKDKSIVLGGRRNKPEKNFGASFEDVSALEQAYIKHIPPEAEQERRKSYDVFLSRKYEELAKNDKRLKKAIKNGNVKYSYIMAQIKKHFPYRPLEDEDSNVGFSLDPLIDYIGMSESLNNLCFKNGNFTDIAKDKELSNSVDSHRQDILSVAGEINKKQGVTSILRFRKKLSVSKINADKQLDAILQNIELNNTYQTARYDGKMKGTTPAMVLFYTDLTAKLWALDYNNLAPKQYITGFNTLSEIKVPKLYWEDFVKLSKTRLWFGLRQESFDINGDSLQFEPIAARVYAASSDPMYPGKESKPNFQSGQFLGWWDNHYSSVADYEPYYYKLNEILKWSCVFLVAKEKHLYLFDYLNDVPVERSLDFETWYKNSTDLKNKTTLPFVDRNKFNRTTECFKILRSNTYPLMDRSFFVSGGVSLASKNDIRKKLGLNITSKKHKTYTSGKTTTVHAKSKLSSSDLKNSRTAKEHIAKKIEPENTYGDFSAKKEDRKIKLAWHKNEGAVLDECVNQLVKAQSGQSQAQKTEDIFRQVKNSEKIVRVELGKLYLIKTKELKDKWIYISVNPEGKLERFNAKAAGTEPYSDIFCAKTISRLEAEKLSAVKQAVTLMP